MVIVFEPTLSDIDPEILPLATTVPLTLMVSVELSAVGVTVIVDTLEATFAV